MSTERILRGVAVLAAVVVIAGGFLFGRSLKGGTEAGFAFDYDQPAYQVTGPAPALTSGGFSGFGETPGLSGLTQLSGRIVSVSPTQVTIEATNGAQTTLRLAEPRSLARIEAADRSRLRAGMTVIVRHEPGSNDAEAVLIVEQP